MCGKSGMLHPTAILRMSHERPTIVLQMSYGCPEEF